MKEKKHFEVIIVGGSYAGLSAAMALGRSLRDVLIIDGGKPCNEQTPYSHNFITQDGVQPKVIADKAKEQVLNYKTIELLSDTVISTDKVDGFFEVKTKNKSVFSSKKILFATGVKDLMPEIKGFSTCWGISVLHCPYCHGYEVRNKKTGILANGEAGFELSKLIQHWTDDLTLFTNGISTIETEQRNLIDKLGIEIIEKEIEELENTNGFLKSARFTDGTRFELDAMYARVPFDQHCKVPAELGCNLTEHGYIDVDPFQKTSVDGVFAAGDNSTPMRTVSVAVADGTKAGAVINIELINESLPN